MFAQVPTSMRSMGVQDSVDEEDTLREGQYPRSRLPLTLLSESARVFGMSALRKSNTLAFDSSAQSVQSTKEKLPESGERLKPWNPGPLSNEPEMEGVFHVLTFFYLLSSLRWYWRDKQNWFAIGNLSVFYPEYSRRAGRIIRKKLSFRGPDFFVALGVNPDLPRNSWVVEREGKYPDVIVEILSKSTAKKDRGEKKNIYERIFKTHEYFLFDPDTKRIDGFRLSNGRYQPIPSNAMGHFWSERLQLAFGMHGEHLRFFTADDTLVPLPDEAASHAMMERELARAEKDFATLRAQFVQKENDQLTRERKKLVDRNDRLSAKLRALGIDPDHLD